MIVKACRLAYKDYIHDGLLSACAILSLAAVLAPLLVLYGVKFGVIQTMTDRLKNDPRNLEIIPVSSGYYTKEDLHAMQETTQGAVGFVLPRTRSIAATMSLAPYNSTNILQRITASLEPTAKGDTLLQHYGVDTSKAYSIPHPKDPEKKAFAITLSAEAARKLQAEVGSALVGRVERLHQGKVERASITLVVQNILPLEAQQKNVAFIPLELLEATEDFRDGRAPAENDAKALLLPELGWLGEKQEDTKEDARTYAGFRLYAKDLNGVTTLRNYFAQKNIDVFTQAEQIAAVRSLDTSLTLIFTLIGGAAALGFWASTTSNVLAAVRRKERYLGILRLMGYSSKQLMAFPLFQSLLTSVLGAFLAAIIYAITAALIDHLFAQSLQGVEKICFLPSSHFALATLLVCFLSLAATVFPANRAARIEPSEVIRDV